MKEDVIRICSQGIDWMTQTAVDEEKSAFLMTRFKQLQVELGIDPSEVKPWQGMGYKGWRFEGAACGVRSGNEAILILSGHIAKITTNPIPEVTGKVTRLDFQVTVELSEPDPMYAQRCYTVMDDLQIMGGRKRAIKLIKSTTGSTLYVGGRGSSVLLRLYDKSYQLGSPELGKYWRYEVEFKRDSAMRAWKLFHVKHLDDEYLTAVVWNEFDRRGLSPRFKAGLRVSAIEVGARMSSVEGQLGWLRRCVAPVVVQLINLGYEEEGLKSIKLKHMFNRKKV